MTMMTMVSGYEDDYMELKKIHEKQGQFANVNGFFSSGSIVSNDIIRKEIL